MQEAEKCPDKTLALLIGLCSLLSAGMLFKNAPAMLHHVVAVFSQIATSKLVIVRRVPGAVLHCPLCLKPIQGLTIALVALFVLKPRLPRLMTVLAIGIDPAG